MLYILIAFFIFYLRGIFYDDESTSEHHPQGNRKGGKAFEVTTLVINGNTSYALLDIRTDW